MLEHASIFRSTRVVTTIPAWFRYNPTRLKYLLVKNGETSLWGEAGYDFQYDVRRERNASRSALTSCALDANNQPIFARQDSGDHSARLFAGYKHAFNKEVARDRARVPHFVEGTRYRVNF